MSEKIFINPAVNPIGPGSLPQQKTATVPVAESFDSIFQKQLSEATDVKFSAHAMKRLESRQISLGANDLAQIKDAVNRAQAKGARESLILMDQLALVVSIKNRTVITAVDGNSLKDNVFTNIDSAVIIK